MTVFQVDRQNGCSGAIADTHRVSSAPSRVVGAFFQEVEPGHRRGSAGTAAFKRWRFRFGVVR